MGLVGFEELKKNHFWFVSLGILLIITGTIAAGEAFIMTVFSMKFLGWLLIIAGVATLFHAFAKERGWGGFFLDILTGVLYTLAGYLILSSPAASAVTLTLIIAYLLMFEGLFRVIAALTHQLPHRGWVFLSGLATMTLGFLIQWGWPLTGAWVIGLYVGVSMILNGWSLVMLSRAVKGLPEAQEGGGGRQAAAA